MNGYRATGSLAAAVFLLAGLAGGAPVYGDEPAPVEIAPGKERLISRQMDSEVMAGSLISADVMGSTGEKIGRVRDLIFDVSGRVVGVVVGVGGLMGIGEKSVGVPFGRMTVAGAKEARALVLRTDISLAELEAAPAFQSGKKGQPPDGKRVAPQTGDASSARD